jgi:adenosylcobinamide-GDP ribazoletransferase
MKPILAALQFMTILPLRITLTRRDLERAPIWFPFAGLLVGLGVAAMDWVGVGLLPSTVANVLTIAMLAAVTGGLHLDGLADTADGFFSARPRERVLEIMGDSRIGAMGVLGVIFILGLKVAALSEMQGALRWSALVFAPLAGRSVQLAVMSLLPYARGEDGIASLFLKRRHPLHVLLAIGWVGAGAFILFSLPAASVVLVAVFSGAAFLSVWSIKRIKGFTGDTLGATSEVIEAIALIVLSCL